MRKFLILFFVAMTAGAVNHKPFVIPELKEWRGGEGALEAGLRVAACPELAAVAETFAEDYREMFGTRLRVAKEGDFVFVLEPGLDREEYKIEIAERVTIVASTPTGAFWATRTLLQMAEQGPLPRGTIHDWPDYPMRGFMLDCGRKFFPMHELRDYVKVMAYYKMNAFQVHLNDSGFPYFFDNDWNKTYGAFRLQSDTFPRLTAQDGSYTKQEFIELQKLAETYCVEIIPEIDVPAHSIAFSHYLPEIGSEEYGADHLDLFNPATYDFLDALFAEYLGGDEPIFRGPRVHIGTDEYPNKKQEVAEKFRYFTDRYIRYVESFGKQAGVWGALTHARGETPVKSDSVLMWVWNNGYANPRAMVEQGYRIVSIPDGLLYIVPNAGYYYDFLNTEYLYNNWTPAMVGDAKFAERDPAIEGGMFAEWNDHIGNGTSTKDIFLRVYPAIQTLSTKMWTAEATTLDFNTFNTLRLLLSEAPGVNMLGRGASFEVASLKPLSETGVTEIGYDYTVSFHISGVPESRGTVLFSSPNAVFYLADPIRGLMGFARDGYLYTFDYRVEGPATVTITGDQHGTKLYVDGLLRDDLRPYKRWFDGGKRSQMFVSTLVFPLEKSGRFRSKITDFSARSSLSR